jgi:2,3-bisphosphoglycerate-independent phosphoglycerate mutase
MLYKPVMLIIMDGFGLSPSEDIRFDATRVAKMPRFNQLKAQYPFTSLEASGEAVGLPEGQMGNSEVGHLNIGAGRVVYQELTRINKAIQTGEFASNAVLNEAMDAALENKKSVHLLGLVSDGGVHSEMEHLYALLDMARKKGLSKVYVHALMDGRDTPPTSGKGYIEALEDYMRKTGVGQIASVTGRYYTMDRDKRWDRVEKGYRCLVLGEGRTALSGADAIDQAYAREETDEFVSPTVIVNARGRAAGCIVPGDAVIMFNFRADRARQISYAFTGMDFDYFNRPGGLLGARYVTMTQYDVDLPSPVAFMPQNLNNTLGEVVAKAGRRQLRIAETEKYAHVTFFFNGGVEAANPLEDRVLIPSPKVATYDLKPEMSAREVGHTVNEKIREGVYDLIVLNYANPDMVGHTGFLEAAVKAVETVDEMLGSNVDAVLNAGGVALITADHGNAEMMWDEKTQEPHTAHTTNRVPCVLVGRDFEGGAVASGSLRDLAPTILELMGLDKPPEMTGTSLIPPG